MQGMSARNLHNFRRIVLIWPDLEPLQTLLSVIGPIPQTLSAESEPSEPTSMITSLITRSQAGFPALAARSLMLNRLPWQDAAWTRTLFTRLSFSHLLDKRVMDA